jgi:uncharacterized repeat protein (TIGR03803 family)
VFELAHGSGTITTLASLNGTDGANPNAGLIVDSSGNLYATTLNGGASGDGTVFEVAHGSGTITTLASFNGTDGAHPYNEEGLIMDSSGNLYGTTESGGASGDGTVFELVHGGGTITTLASLNGTDGSRPYGSLLMDSSGNLYGTAHLNGATGNGTVFELAHGSGTITTLVLFNFTDGAHPQGGLIMDSSGNLYGTTADGGAATLGTVFELPGAAAPLAAAAAPRSMPSPAHLPLDEAGTPPLAIVLAAPARLQALNTLHAFSSALAQPAWHHGPGAGAPREARPPWLLQPPAQRAAAPELATLLPRSTGRAASATEARDQVFAAIGDSPWTLASN